MKKGNQTNMSTPKKTGTKIYERAERGEIEPSGTTPSMANKQCALLL